MEERIKVMVKDLLEAIKQQERAIYLKEHPTKANGYYTPDLLILVGLVEDLRVPRMREGDSHPTSLPKTGLPRAFGNYPRPLHRQA